MNKYAIYSSFIFLVLSSCMLGPNFTSPEVKTNQYFINDSIKSSEILNLEWWQLFDDDILDTLVNSALINNNDIRIAANRIEAARINIGFTKADQYPTFRYGANVSGSGLSGNSSSTLNFYPEVSYELGFWGKYRRLNESAQANYLATESAQQMVQLSVVTAVVSTYYNIIASHDQLSIASSTLASRDSGLVIMHDKLETGLISLMDYNQAKIQRDVAATVVPTYRRIIAQNENALSILLGELPQNIETGRPFHEHNYNFDIPVGVPSELLQRRPDIKQSEAIYMARNAQIGVAEAMRWPSLSLTGLIGGASNDLSSLNSLGLTWSASASIFGPIFQFGKNKDRVKIAVQDAQQSLIQYEQNTLNAFREVEDALVSITTYKEELGAQESRTRTAIESEELSYLRYAEGSTTYLEVLEQQRQSFSAQLDLLKNRLNLVNSYIILYKALGGGWLTADTQQANTNQ